MKSDWGRRHRIHIPCTACRATKHMHRKALTCPMRPCPQHHPSSGCPGAPLLQPPQGEPLLLFPRASRCCPETVGPADIHGTCDANQFGQSQVEGLLWRAANKRSPLNAGRGGTCADILSGSSTANGDRATSETGHLCIQLTTSAR